MAQQALTASDWQATVAQLGGAAALEAEARASGAFVRARKVKSGLDQLRLTLAYCLGACGLRLTAAWSEGIGLADLSNVALLGRLRNMVPWLVLIVARLLAAQATKAPGLSRCGAGASRQRLIRLIDATTVRKKGKWARESGQLWRIHAGLDLPFGRHEERFSAFEVTDEKGAERIDRLAVVPGEIRVADRIHCRTEGLARVIAAGADIVVRAGWQSARWLDANGAPLDLLDALERSQSGLLDRSVGLARADAEPLTLRLIAIRMPNEKAVAAVAQARKDARSKQRAVQRGTLIAAEWVILVTSLDGQAYSADQVLDLYRLRWRIEIAFKRLKSIIGLAAPPGECPEVAKAWVLCHLIAVLLTEAQMSPFGDSPRRAAVRGQIIGAPSAC